MRLAPWLCGLDTEGLTLLFALRPDVCRARPGSVPELSRQLAPLLATLRVTVAEGQIERVARRLDVGRSVVVEAISQSRVREHVAAGELPELHRLSTPSSAQASGRRARGR